MTPAADGSDEAAFHIKISYRITPSTPTSTYDFWAVSRDFARDDIEVDEFLFKQNATVVGQDVDAPTMLEERIAADPDDFELNIKIDRGGLAARRILRGLVDAQAGGPSAD